MVHDFFALLTTLSVVLLEDEIFINLCPTFTLMGSVPEGTRIGIGNEMDIMMEFGGFDAPPFKVKEGDPFHLYATDHIPEWMKRFLDQQGRFIFHLFMRALLDAVSLGIDKIFKQKRNPKRLIIKTTNEDFNSDRLDCNDCKRRKKEEERSTLFKQCDSCIVAVSQTKVGIGLQFLWKSDNEEEIYSSVDLVPTFNINPIDPLDLARIINSAMLSQRPDGWFNYMKKYAKADLIVTDLLVKERDQAIGSVLLKNLNCSLEQNYFVRPGQHLAAEKFKTKEHRRLYQNVKALKTILDVDLNNYMLKKLLLKPIEFKIRIKSHFLYDVMCMPELKEKFEEKIDYEEWKVCRAKSKIPRKF
jgi:hypothetical protein